MTKSRPILAAALLAGLSACAPSVVQDGGRRAAPPPPSDPPPVAQIPGPDLQDWALTPGGWSYARGSTATTASFGTPGAAPVAWLRCDLATHAVRVGRGSAAPGSAMLGVVTSFGRTDWPAAPATAGVEASRVASDPGLDAIAFSRGRFALMLAGAPTIVLPSWAEPARVIEDCRG